MKSENQNPEPQQFGLRSKRLPDDQYYNQNESNDQQNIIQYESDNEEIQCESYFSNSLFFTIHNLRINDSSTDTKFIGEGNYIVQELNIKVQLSLTGSQLIIYLFSQKSAQIFYQITIHEGIIANCRKQSNILLMMANNFTDICFNNCKNDITSQRIIIELKIDVSPQSQIMAFCSDGFSLRGLINQGNTCYMNCLIQILSHLNIFKKNVYLIEDLVIGKFPASLQQLFYKLDYEKGNHAISTKDLLTSFEWAEEDAWIQQDVQEFFMQLIEALDNKLKQSNNSSNFIRLFQGITESQITCINVDSQSKIKEEFSDIQLEVQGIQNLQDSLEKYCQEEQLTRDNAFQTDIFGKQDAVKKTQFQQLPDVMIFHLKRFKYNGNMQEKILDKFEYPMNLNMTQFMVNYAKEEFTLYGILVHKGLTDQSGHYITFIKDFISNQWVEFNDSNVKIVGEKEAFNDNFGGEYIEAYYDEEKKEIIKQIKKCNQTAYMLIYVRQQNIQEIFEQIEENQVPNWIKIKEQNEQQKERDREIKKNNLLLPFFLYDQDINREPMGIIYSKNYYNTKIYKEIKINKTYQLPLKDRFSDALLNQDILRPQFKYFFIYRLFLDSFSQCILAEQVVPFTFYEENSCKALANNLEIQQQKVYLMKIDEFFYNDYDNDQILVFLRHIENSSSSIQFQPAKLTKSTKISKIAQIYQIQNGRIYFQDEFYHINEINNQNQTLNDLIQNENLSDYFIQIIFSNEETIQQIQQQLHQVKFILINQVDRSEQILAIHRISSFDEFNLEVSKLVGIKQEELLLQYEKEDGNWIEIDHQLVQQIERSNKQFPIFLTNFSNKVLYSSHKVPFLQRSFHLNFTYEIIEENKIFSREAYVQKNETIFEFILKEIEKIESFQLVPKENILIGVKNEKNYLINVKQSTNHDNQMSVEASKKQHYQIILFNQKDFQKYQNEERILIICNIMNGDQSKQSFVLQCPKQMKIREILELAKDTAKINGKVKFYLGESQKQMKIQEITTQLHLQDFIETNQRLNMHDKFKLYLELLMEREVNKMKTIK